jgi:sortase A
MIWLIVFFLLFTRPGPEIVIIPSIGMNESVFPVGIINRGSYYTYEVLDNHPGWHSLSAEPGTVGNTVLSGHSNVLGKVFKDLHLVEVGDQITLFDEGISYKYRVQQIVILKEEGASPEEKYRNGLWIGPTTDNRLTIVTCINGTESRLLVVAFPE